MKGNEEQSKTPIANEFRKQVEEMRPKVPNGLKDLINSFKQPKLAKHSKSSL